MISRRATASTLLLLFLTAILAFTPAFAAGEAKESLKKIGDGAKKLGRKVGDAGKEAGREVAGAAKKIWYKGKQVSKPLLDRTQEATREFWRDVIRGKDRAIAEMKKENERLRRKLEGAE